MTGWMVGDDIEGCVRMRQQQMVTTMARQQMVKLTIVNAMRRGQCVSCFVCNLPLFKVKFAKSLGSR
jgi:hypothetical protein